VSYCSLHASSRGLAFLFISSTEQIGLLVLPTKSRHTSIENFPVRQAVLAPQWLTSCLPIAVREYDILLRSDGAAGGLDFHRMLITRVFAPWMPAIPLTRLSHGNCWRGTIVARRRHHPVDAQQGLLPASFSSAAVPRDGPRLSCCVGWSRICACVSFDITIPEWPRHCDQFSRSWRSRGRQKLLGLRRSEWESPGRQRPGCDVSRLFKLERSLWI